MKKNSELTYKEMYRQPASFQAVNDTLEDIFKTLDKVFFSEKKYDELIFTGCGSSNATTGTDTTQEAESTDTAATDTPAAEDSKGGDFSGLISPISREEGSGTRGAFIELFGIETKDTDGNKIERIEASV